MGDFPGVPFLFPEPLVISSLGPCSPYAVPTMANQEGGVTAYGTSITTWAANAAVYVPIRVPSPVTVYKLSCCTGSGTTGNFDLGIYDQAGNKIISTGSTARTTASVLRSVDITDTVLLGGFYYLALASDTSTADYASLNFDVAIPNAGYWVQFGQLLGVREQASAFPLPSTATMASFGTNAKAVPLVGAHLRSE